ncbi:uncharacterized protein LOC131943037 [Physella acuta]|uniref:uncharacterized protein LOC131943037 n=1 Tax=Physella acuta TaxID=109671 RepID=UPI0027DBC451|nr:uncharacterized protein LOC131943037 [Physella acuta]
MYASLEFSYQIRANSTRINMNVQAVMMSVCRFALLLTLLSTVQAADNKWKNSTAPGNIKFRLFSERWADFEQRWLYNFTDPIFSRVLEPLANSSPFLNGTATGWLIDAAEQMLLNKDPKVSTMLTQFADKAVIQLTTALKEALLEGIRGLNEGIRTMVTGTVNDVKDAAVKHLESSVKELTKKLMPQLPTIPKPSIPVPIPQIPLPNTFPKPWKF